MPENNASLISWQNLSFFRFTENSLEDTMSSVSGEGSTSISMDTSGTESPAMLHYEAESPDELALVQAASSYGCKLLKRTPDRVMLSLPGKYIGGGFP